MKKMSKVLALILALAMVLTGCSTGDNGSTAADTTTAAPAADSTTAAPAADSTTAAPAADSTTAAPAEDNKATFKIGIMTDTVTQGEEAYRTAEEMVAKYGEDRVVHMTFPDKASSEQEVTISTFMSLASDPDMKVIVAAYAMEGTTAAFQKIREVRPDIVLLGGAPTEDPAVLSGAADLIVGMDYIGMGTEVAETAKRMGATTLVHYSFPRHMANSIYLARHDAMQAKCKELGIEFVDGTTPDPMAEAGVSATQQFIMEDVPRKVEQYGKQTAFFSTNVGMHEALIKSIYEQGALFPHPDTPSPFYCYPGALGIEVPAEKNGDADWMVEQIAAKLSENGMSGRMGVWMPPAMPLVIESLCEYGNRVVSEGYGEGEFLQPQILEDVVKDLGEGRYSCSVYTEGDFNNYYVYLSETVLIGE